MEKTDILVVGGGPVGMMLALELSRFGVQVILVNDRTETSINPKANAINARSMEHFRRHGVGPTLRAAGLPTDHPTDVCYVTGLTGRELTRLHMPSSDDSIVEARAGSGPYDCAEPPHRCSQIYLEVILRDALFTRSNVDVRLGQKLESFCRTDTDIVATVRNLEGDTTYEISARHLVGADGGQSTVRRQLDIRYLGDGGVERKMMGGAMLATLFEMPEQRDWLTIDTAWMYWIVAHDLRALLIAVDGANKFGMLTRIPDGTDPDEIDDHALLEKAAGMPVAAEIILRTPWTAGHELLAESFGDDRVWLVGDAAHLFTPTGGLGMNTGIDDAVNLAWKLAADVRGWGGPDLLSSYEADRRPIGARNLAFARGFAESIGTFDVDPCVQEDSTEGEAERARLSVHLEDHSRREMIIPGIALGVRYTESQLVTDDGSALVPDDAGTYIPTARPGHRAPHVWLGNGEALCDQFADGFTLLRTDPDVDAEPVLRAARETSVPLTLINIAEDAVRARYAAALVLIFPDGHVAWRGDAAPDDARAVINRARGVPVGA